MPIQLPATCTTARWPSIRTSCACCDSSIRVEGSSRLPRICCQSSGRLVFAAGAAIGSAGDDEAVSGVGSGSAAAGVAWGVAVGGNETAVVAGAGWAAGVVGAAGVSAVGLGAGGLCCAAGGLGAVTGRGWLSASRPISSTSSQSRGCTLRRSCCSAPRSCACHCSSRARPIRCASSGSWARCCGDTPVSSGLSGAAAINTRSRRIPARP